MDVPLDAVGLAAFASAAVAAITGLLAALPCLLARIDERAFGTAIIRLLKAANADRAARLCACAPRSPFAVAVLRCLETAKESPTPGAEALSRLHRVFATTMDAEIARLRGRGVAAGVAALAASVTLYLVLGQGATPLALVGVALALVELLYVWTMLRRTVLLGIESSDRILGLLAGGI